ncbi:DNA-binding transcriptional activator PunR [Vibrio marisflavi]|uniref:HTH-type transcriptional regulator YahB n=1 Tax=Vibrio marisflavi CECT 7928 TaxID=634439 RepID=A0ABN8E881_9VIBR|nr:DNA-binding transcriptional activator PunR [Vibrio marisflavi]CAH0541991.1 putative HTH-type transcriptional regulator YahB [Vibrio marisflavi CECT 7928]
MYSKSSLELIDTIARLESFAAAAEVLHRVPSAISYSVRQLERDLGVVLFKRLPRKVELTEAGIIFVSHARDMLRQMDEVTIQTQRAASGWKQTLKITLDNIVRLEKMERLVSDFYATFDFAELQINMEVFNGSWEAISQGRADIAIGATSAIPVGGEYNTKNMGSMEWVFVMSPSHPCAKAAQLTEELVSKYSAICLDDTSRELPKRHNSYFPNQRRLLLPNWHTAIDCLKKGLGVGYMPRHMASKHLQAGTLIERSNPLETPNSECCLVWRRDPTNKLIQWMVDYLGSSEQLYQDWLKA